jgi:hypothetical protein
LSGSVAVLNHRKFQAELLQVLSSVDSAVKIKILSPSISHEIVSLNKDIEQSPAYLLGLINCFAVSQINSVFLKNGGVFFDLFVGLLKNFETKAEMVACSAAFSVISHKWFASLDLSLKQRIFDLLIDAQTSAPSVVKDLVKLVGQEISVAPEVIEPKLSQITQSLLTSDGKRLKAEGDAEQAKIFTLIAFLEFLQTIPTDGLLELVPRIVVLLDGLLNFPIESFSNVEYCKQLVLLVLESIIKDSPEASEISEDLFRVDLIVQCIRITDNPQTHNAALLLLATIGKVHSEIVLVNIMPVFTFMGANILRQDDNYSFHVVQKTLETIIPALLRGDEDPLVYVKKVLQVFVNALEHVPSHRRLKLFTILAQTIGAQEYLGTLLVLLIAHPMIELEKSIAPNGDPLNIKKFSIKLLHEFNHTTQVLVLTNLMERLDTIPDEPAVQQVPAVVDTSVLKTRTIRLIKLHILQFVNQFLKTMQATLEEKESCGPHYMKLLQSQLFTLTTYASEQGNPSWNKYANLLSTLLYDNLDSINSMFSLRLFVEVVNNLIIHENLVIQKRALGMLQERIKAIGSVEIDVGIFDDISITLKRLLSSDSQNKEEFENKQEVLLSLACMVDVTGATQQKEVQELLPLVIKHGLKSTNMAVSSTAMITIGVLVKVLKARAIPFLNKFLPVILDLMQLVTDPDELLVVYSCAITSMLTLVDVIPQFLSSYIGKFIALLCEPKVVATDHSELEPMALDMIQAICEKVESRVLIPVMQKITIEAKQGDKQALLRMFNYTGVVVTKSLQSSLVEFHKDWIKLFLGLFSIQPLGEVEQPLIGLFIKYTLKLNESTFKPLFIKMYDWSMDDDGDQLVFFKLVHALLENLKSIFVPYFGIVFDSALELIIQKRNAMWKVVMSTLMNCFRYDSTGFVSEERFEKAMPALVGLLDIEPAAEEYKQDMEMVIASLGLLAKACHQEPLWKKLNKQALMKTRSANGNVRWAGLKVVHELYTCLGEEMLVFFPETIPFLAEVMEDDDPEVEMACQDLCMVIQKFLGEPIQQYFSSV